MFWYRRSTVCALFAVIVTKKGVARIVASGIVA